MARVSKLLSTWVKAPSMRGATLLVCSECLPTVAPEIYKRFEEQVDHVLLACPEREPQCHYGKLASIVRSCKPRKMIVVTVDGSPHCFTLHAAVNEAEYILGERVEREHYVVLDAKHVVRIRPEAVRVARYLSLVEKLIEKHPEILEELAKHSLEQRLAEKLKELKEG